MYVCNCDTLNFTGGEIHPVELFWVVETCLHVHPRACQEGCRPAVAMAT